MQDTKNKQCWIWIYGNVNGDRGVGVGFYHFVICVNLHDQIETIHWYMQLWKYELLANYPSYRLQPASLRALHTPLN